LAQTAEAASAQPALSMKYSAAPESLALIGFMGAGKTTVGRLLAARLGWQFQDLDDLIVDREGRSISAIFRDHGERYFRDLENRVLCEFATDHKSRLVLALGGGAFVDAANRRVLQQAGFCTVFLDAPVDELFLRCAQPDVIRPLRQDIQKFSDLYKQRRPQYRKCSLHIDTTGKPVAGVAEEIVRALNLLTTPGASE
jgi:shikimate kinase